MTWKRIPLEDFLPKGCKLSRRKQYEINEKGELRSIDISKLHEDAQMNYTEIQPVQKGDNKYFVVYAGARGGVTLKPFIPLRRIMAHVFINPLSKDDAVEFKEGNDLRVDNLKIVNVGMRNRRIESLREAGYKLKEIADEVGLDKSQVSIILNRR